MISPKPPTSPTPKAINNERCPGLLPVPYSYVFLNFIDFNRTAFDHPSSPLFKSLGITKFFDLVTYHIAEIGRAHV